MDKIIDVGTDITPENSIVPIFLIPLTDEQELDRELSEKARLDFEAEIIAKNEAKESAINKLTKLGLTLDEANAVIGTN